MTGFDATKKLSIVCPIVTNDGLSLDAAIDTIASHLARLTGGVSEYSQRGMWFDDNGSKYSDQSRVLYTFCSEEQISQLNGYFTLWAKQLEQICLLVSVEPAYIQFAQGIEYQQAA